MADLRDRRIALRFIVLIGILSFFAAGYDSFLGAGPTPRAVTGRSPSSAMSFRWHRCRRSR